ncbi:hypothetical protein [Streptomyces noursei]|uniref:hypothetical protein n=1 Tax=Streptomyces noursei TaxID=1971 RepID=UPI003B8A5EA3
MGPRFTHEEDRSELLASCYRESLRVADELGAVRSRSLPSPPVSTGGPWRTPPGSRWRR